MDSDVVIVGAGISGLSAGKLLTENGLKVLVLEARDRVGGRTYTKRDPKVNYVDLGGAYVGQTQYYVHRMAKELGLNTYKVHEVENILYYKDGKRMLCKPTSTPRHGNPFVNMDINNILWLIDELGQEIPSHAPWNAPRAKEWDTKTYKEFLEENCWTQRGKEILKNFVNQNTASEPHEISLLGLLWYVKQVGGTKIIDSSEGGAQEMKFIGGSQQISERIAEKLGDQIVIKNSPVIFIDQTLKDFVKVRTLNGKEYKTKYVILALPPILQMKIHFQPQLPAFRNQLIQRLPMGSVIKVILYYKTTFWRENGMCGTMTINGGEEHPMLITMDDTKPDGSYPAIIGFILGDKCRNILDKTPNQRKAILAKSLAIATGCPEALTPVHYEEKCWMEEQYSGGCYTAIPTPGFLTNYGRALREPVDRLHFAGTETATRWSGYMDGAIQAGERASREILHRMGKINKEEIWQTEPIPKEKKSLPQFETFSEKYIPSISGILKTMTISTFLGAVSLMFIKKDVLFKRI